MSITSDVGSLFENWIAAVSTAVGSVVDRLLPRQQVTMVEGRDASFTIRTASIGKGRDLPEIAFRIADGLPSPRLPIEWIAALRGSHIVLHVNPDQILLRPLEFPRQATEFLDGMIRAQIDRITPWSAQDVAFGWSEPKAIAADRVHLTLAATARRAIEPLVTLARNLGAHAVAGVVEQPIDDGQTRWIVLFDLPIEGAAGSRINIPRILRWGLLGSAMIAATSLLVATYVVGNLDSDRQQLQSQIAARRAALRLNQNGVAGSAQALLVKRKQTAPATVMVLESISKVLPDGTYVTELRVEGDKVQIVGMTQDAPPLIRLIEQSPQFTQATFFAPTTRTQNEVGERFHIEAHVKPYFGPAS
jgi:general secretion pathway protein L